MKGILEFEYLRAKKIVDEYELQIKNSTLKVNDISVNQKVGFKMGNKESKTYWVSEISGNDVLIRTTESENDPDYDDFWFNISDLKLI